MAAPAERQWVKSLSVFCKAKCCKDGACLTWIPWVKFKSLSEIYFLRISYVVLVGVPLLAAIQNTSFGSFFGEVPITLRLGYFSSLLLSLAHMIYQGYCPQIIRRFESPNDLYRDMLEIKALQHQYLPSDTGFTVGIAHCRMGFTDANHKYWFARLLCAVFYWSGVTLAVWVIAERTYTVFDV